MNVFHIQSIGEQWHCEAMQQCQPTFQKSSFGYRYFTISLLPLARNDPGTGNSKRNQVFSYASIGINTVTALVLLKCALAKQIYQISCQYSLTAVPISTTYKVIISVYII